MEYYAHKTDDGKMQTVQEHLNNTAKYAVGFAVDMFKPLVYEAAIAHDIGKFSKSFQNRLNGSTERFEHSLCGAIEYKKLDDLTSDELHHIALMLEYVSAGHHSGLPDGGTDNDTAEDSTLTGRFKRSKNYIGDSDYGAYKDMLNLHIKGEPQIYSELSKAYASSKSEYIELYAFFTRYIFSCLTDADFLDTEEFCGGKKRTPLKCDFEQMYKAVENKLCGFKCETRLQKARSRLQKQAFENAEKSSNISILNMPTGSGKTLCSLKIALEKVLRDKTKKRIIYVIPYTSIIEQTAVIFEELAGDDTEILQHHSNYSFDDNNEPSTAEKLKKASENWDAPLIITTSVQFFESLYHYKGSSLRKLHNMADSVIIFDEVHLLPTEMLRPCLSGIGHITKYLNSEAIFLSATMPDYTDLFKKYLPKDTKTTELITDKSDFAYFKKCNYIYMPSADYDSVIAKASEYQSSLIVVNTKKTAHDVYKKLPCKKYHLSTLMTPCDRSEVIKQIRKDLASGEKITVVSTSLIEAGVDLDFKAVFREITGLDSILQSGGRCNREGKYESGDVFVFQTDNSLNRGIEKKAQIVKSMLKREQDITSLESIRDYYKRLEKKFSDEIKNNHIANDENIPCVNINNLPFRSYAERFQFIRDDSIGIVILNCNDASSLYDSLKYGNFSAKRKLQKYTVPVRIYDFKKSLDLGIIDDFGTGVFSLTNDSYYNNLIGLDLDKTDDQII